MSLKVTLVGSHDRELESALRACGATVAPMAMTELMTLVQPAAPQPDLLVIDLRQDGAVPPALTALKRQHATTPVIVVARTLDSDLLLSALRAGVQECVAEPITHGDLDAAITRVVAGQSAPASSQAFAIVGAKGGVGATSLAVNVATALSRVATSGTLLVDLHVARGDAALYLGVEPRFSVTDALENVQKLDAAFFRPLVTRAAARLDVLAAPESGSLARLEAPRVRGLLEFVSKHFEFTVVDVPRTEPGALDALEAMKSIIVLTTQELPAVRSAAVLANRLRQRYGKERVLVVMSRLDRHADISHEDVEKVLGAPLAHAFPSNYRVTMAALNQGRPVVLDNHSELAVAFEQFARALAGLKAEKKAAPASLWTRLVGGK